jgi:hypothetical protein
MTARKLTPWILILGAAVLTACGRPSDEQLKVREGMIPVDAKVGFASQCPSFGTVGDPFPVSLGLWSCPIDQGKIELSRPMMDLLFAVDCKKKLLSVRSADRKKGLDTLWETMPDGTFNVTIDAAATTVPVYLKDDGTGGGECVAYAQLQVYGRADCKDLDHVDLDVTSDWHLTQGHRPANPSTSLRECQLPSSCFLEAESVIKQCQ